MLPSLRHDFPFLQQLHPAGKPWVYLDSAATTLKPHPVIETMTTALSLHSTNVHRSVYGPGDITTEKYETARRKIARLLGAQPQEVVLVRNTTEAINMVASGYPRNGVTLASWGEHHSNLLPWQRGAFRGIAPLPDGRPNIPAMIEELRKGDVSIVAISHLGNVTGFVTELSELIHEAHRHHAIVVVDAAQSAGRMPLDVHELDCDFLACSAHKMYGPSGIGLLYGKTEHLLKLRPWLLGGGTVETVTHQSHTVRSLPWKLEAGTPAIEATIAWGAAVDYLQSLGMDEIEAHESVITEHAVKTFRQLGDRIHCPWYDNNQPLGTFSFHIPGESSHVIARTLSDRYGICVRSGHLCAQPLLEDWKSPPLLRLSFGIYNTIEEIDSCYNAIREVVTSLRR